ncbi:MULTISPECIES: hypothetical protein [Marinovum]|uniref:hypothetical protein n=1 Tax=Marinovum TaxID=367771 RepID=UPI00237A937C|nr:hypothetical protein [Marinovum sp. PR37]MDD9742688.1 hypothetical protein [Marinovum sp. PR37]
MRVMLGIFGLLVGLLSAVALFGAVGHLRQAAPESLPPWTAGLDDAAGLVSGRAEVAAGTPWPEDIALTWAWAGLEAGAPRWRVTAGTTGAQASAHLLLPAPFSHARLQGGSGSLDLAALPALGARGEVRLDRLEASVITAARRLERLTGAGRILGAYYDGTLLGNGSFNIATDAGGAWRLRIELAGPAVALEGRLSGLIGGAEATLDARIIPREAMPEAWRQSLDLLADRLEAGGWQVRTRLPLR